ncbi:hypothetical protein PINS_up011054 [Pythium insidiosum]|nr:hypothetical protein PINS_up011054 [Pythium insidiosum]
MECVRSVYEELRALVMEQIEHEEQERASGSRKRRLVHGATKKARALVTSTDALVEQCLPVIFSRHVRQVAILFGASIASPREVWLLSFREEMSTTVSTSGSPDALPLADRERRRRLCVQKIIRTVLSYATQHFTSAVAPTSLHLLFQANLDENDTLPGFVPRPNWKLRVPKSKSHKRLHVIEISTPVDTSLDQETATSEGVAMQSLPRTIWMQRQGLLQGFKGAL